MKSLLQSDKTKQVLKILLSAVLIMITLFAMTACGETPKPDVKVSTSLAKIDGISVTVGETTTKEFVEGEDSEGRVNLYGDLGELKQYTINVSGEVSIAECNEKAIAMNDGNVVEDDSTPIGYYTDFFEMKFLAPEGATKVGYIDGNSQKLDTEIGTLDEDGYYTESVQWLLGNTDKTNWNTCGNADTQDGYFYFKFLNDEDKIVDHFFVKVVYDVEFVD